MSKEERRPGAIYVHLPFWPRQREALRADERRRPVTCRFCGKRYPLEEVDVLASTESVLGLVGYCFAVCPECQLAGRYADAARSGRWPLPWLADEEGSRGR